MITSRSGAKSGAGSSVQPEPSEVPKDVRAHHEESTTNDSPIGRQATPRTRGSPIVQYFTHIAEGRYACLLCRERNRNNPRNSIKRQADGSTNVFWRHFKTVHPDRHDQLKGINGKQIRIPDAFNNAVREVVPPLRALRRHTVEETNDVIMRFICLTRSPWSTVDSVAFKDLWRYATQVDLDPPSANVIKCWTMQMFEQMKEDIKRLFVDVEQVSLTAYAWTAEDCTGLLGITVHWVDTKWHYCERVLGIRELVGKHDGDRMAEIIVQLLEEFALTTKVKFVAFYLL